MTTNSSPTYDDDEIQIDFGKYIETLVRQWQWIVACALGLGILALALSLLINLASPSYRAVVLVSSSQTQTNVNFGSAITSTSDIQSAQAAAAGAQYLYDRKARLQSFVSLAQNGAVAEQVLEELGPKLNNKKGEPTTAAALLRMVSADLISSTDTIQISVTYSDPVLAAEIANAWGQAYVQQINELYGDSSVGTSSLALQAQIAQNKTAYEKAQTALTSFIAQDKTNEYGRQIDEIQIIVASLRESLSAVANQEVQDRIVRLKQAYADSRQVGLLLDNAVSMRDAVKTGGDAAAISNALALTMLKTQIYAAFPGTNTLQVQNLPEALGSTISTVNAAGMDADLNALISTLKKRQTELNNQIDVLSSEIQKGDNLKYLDNVMTFSTVDAPIEKRIEENEQKIRDLNSLISIQSSALTELTRARDLAWESYKALATKGMEASVSAQTTGSQVIFASPATPPDEKIIRSRNNAGLATGVGLLIGVIVAYAYEFWQNYKGRQPEIIFKEMFAYAKSVAGRMPIKPKQPAKRPEKKARPKRAGRT